jgi:hypothetical protein
MMLEGVSVRAISRLTSLHVQTILDLMLTASENAQKVFDRLVRNIRPKYVQLDEKVKQGGSTVYDRKKNPFSN